tara:strand:+ start:5763 stop:7025 length:1263 start_codon:yes stop_codon:yes gene_type:complete
MIPWWIKERFSKLPVIKEAVKKKNEEKVKKAFELISNNRYREAFKIVDPDDLTLDSRSLLLLSLFRHEYRTRIYGERKITNDLWQGLVNGFRDEDFQSLGESRNEVLEIGHEHLKGSVVVKRGPNLEGEYLWLKKLDKGRKPGSVVVLPFAWFRENRLKENTGPELREEYKTAKAMHDLKAVSYQENFMADIFGLERRETLVTRRSGEPTLSEWLEGVRYVEEIQKEFDTALENLAIMHANPLLDFPIPTYSAPHNLKRRLFGRLDDGELSERLLLEYTKFYVGFDFNLEETVHSDFSIHNVLRGGTIFDPQPCFGEVALDIETLLSFEAVEQIDRERAMKVYKNKREEEEKKEITISNWIFYAVHVALCYTGTFYNKGELERANHFAKRAVDILGAEGQSEFRDEFLRYLEASPFTIAW